MADFYGTLLSTSFRVKNDAAFLADSDIRQFKTHCEENGFFERCEDGYWAFGWDGQYPSLMLHEYGESREEDKHIDVPEAIKRHIAEDGACCIRVSGNEKLRYNGGTVAYISAHGVVWIDAHTDWTTRLTRGDVVERFAKYIQAGHVLDGASSEGNQPLQTASPSPN
jgi:hypothetical protein